MIMIASDVQYSLDKLKEKNQIKDYKLVWTNPKTVYKKDLMNYILYLKHIFPNIFKNHNSEFKKFMKRTQRMNKITIVNMINYYVNTKNHYEQIQVTIKGTKSPELVKVYVKKEVHKVI
jgi:hypothetical protein